MKNYTGKIFAAALMLAASQLAIAGGSTAFEELGGLSTSAGITAPEKNAANSPVPAKGLNYAQQLAHYDLLLKEGKISRNDYDSLVGGLRDLANMEALASGKPLPYPELMPAQPQQLKPAQLAAHYKQLLNEGQISQQDYEWLMAGLNDLSQMNKSSRASRLDINNRAHKTVWTTLYLTEQLKVAFVNAGSLKIAGFPVWEEDASAAMRLAGKMDGIFVNMRGAKRNTPDSRDILAGLLSSGRDGKDVRWLADSIDELYTFWGE